MAPAINEPRESPVEPRTRAHAAGRRILPVIIMNFISPEELNLQNGRRQTPSKGELRYRGFLRLNKTY